jgi:Serine acetyltransferase, N-terminal
MGLALPAESPSLWNTIQREAVAVAAAEPVLAAWMHEAIVNHDDLAGAHAAAGKSGLSELRSKLPPASRAKENSKLPEALLQPAPARCLTYQARPGGSNENAFNSRHAACHH